MREHRFTFLCYHDQCEHDPATEVVVRLPDNEIAGPDTKAKLLYCKRDHLNRVIVPDTWDQRHSVLGDGAGSGDDDLPPRGGLPVVKGGKP